MTEDKVRDLLRKKVNCEVGQQTTFKKLGFKVSDVEKIDKDIIEKYSLINVLLNKPDGWYEDKENNFFLVCETKSSDKDIDSNVDQIFKYMYIAQSKYQNVVGILFNGEEHKCFQMINGAPQEVLTKVLEDVKTYIDLFNNTRIEKKKIYQLTSEVNNILHRSYKVSNLKQRMIWTACILVAKRFNCCFTSADTISIIKQKIKETLNSVFDKDISKNAKLYYLIQTLDSIKIEELEEDKDDCKLRMLNAIDDIAKNINSNNWNGEDVMSIFFNEFTRYAGKSDNGQVFTPDHITSLMYYLADIHYQDKVLDACCGSGSFLTKAMCNMIREVGGPQMEEAKKIKQERIFGIENDPDIFCLAIANMLIHKDGKSNIVQKDARTDTAGNWIKSQQITKVLMNPPYEKMYKPIDIILNIMNNVEPKADCLFLLPNNKLRTNKNQLSKIFKKHSLLKIIKLPSNLFSGLASTGDVSIFIFKAHVPQKQNDSIICFHIPYDGLETVKNQGRHDVNGIWETELLEYWINAIKNNEDTRFNSKKIIHYGQDELEYPDEIKEIELFEEDFDKVILDRILFENPELAKKFSEYSPKNNPNGISHKDWILNCLKLMDDNNE